MFSKIFVENDLKNHPQALKILSKYPQNDPVYIESIEPYFDKVKRPYLQKREDLKLFLGSKKGRLVKEAPNAYGVTGEPHFYFIHAYNCIYECTYCYLQGYFSSPDIVLFLNHGEIINEMEATLKLNPDSPRVWFHAGEFSDSLALSHLTGELPLYHDFCLRNPRATIELRTKSSNIQALKNLTPLNNFIVSFSLSPDKEVREHDLKTASLSQRLKAIHELSKRSYPLGFHFDPVVFSEDVLHRYEELFDQLLSVCDSRQVQYISLGVVRFTEKVYRQVKMNYPESSLHSKEMKKSFDGKIRYPQILRMNLLQRLKNALVLKGIDPNLIYFCME
jgi:spore photoproduct lyase